MKKKISIIDSGLSNLYNVIQAFTYMGMEVDIVNDNTSVFNDYLVLPGVGSFKKGMDEIIKKKLSSKIKEHVQSNKPFLGICLGMQMMLSKSYEFGEYNGLGLIQGEIIKIPSLNHNNAKHKIPHIGWNYNMFSNNKDKLINNIDDRASMYFVHSYMASLVNESNILAKTDYNGINVISIIKHLNSYGCQFHPEKSGESGLQLLENFTEI
tara:strand:- start:833 stop:1462 length:630 start_codon:yes stop_codon:yes gene_type:complete